MYEKQRQDLVELLHKKGIRSRATLRAMLKVERHLFVNPSMLYHAYNDTALYIGHGQTISQPYTVAFMTEKLNLKQGDTVLEIGTGSGYQAAILYEMGMRVYTIERSFELSRNVMRLFEKLKMHILVKCADGTIGWNEFAPYNGIIVTAGAPAVPPALQKQLSIGGKLVVPVGDRNSQSLHVITRTDKDEYDVEMIPDFQFVPLIGRDGWKEE